MIHKAKEQNQEASESDENEKQVKEVAQTKSYIDFKEGSPEHVVFLTSDYAMQNVII